MTIKMNYVRLFSLPLSGRSFARQRFESDFDELELT